VLLVGLVAVLTPSQATAAVTISLTSPAPGQPVLNPVTITATYSSSGPALDLARVMIPMASLLILGSLQTPSRESPTYTTPLREQVTLTLTSDRSSYYIKEPISLKLTLTNVAGTPVLGRFMIAVLSPKVKLRYRRSGGVYNTFPYPGDGIYADPSMILEPDGEISDERLLGYDPGHQEFLLPEPGQYEFQAIYTDRHPPEPNTIVESNVLRIEAQTPPEREGEALRSYSRDFARIAQFDPGWARGANREIAFAGWGVSVDAMMQAAHFLDAFPHSAYAPRIRDDLMWALESRIGRSPGSVTAEEKALHKRLKAEKPASP
jgi:hypothetical protein